MVTVAYLLSLVGAIAGGIFLVIALRAATSAPQEAAGAAIALAFTVIPYCFARACQELGR